VSGRSDPHAEGFSSCLDLGPVGTGELLVGRSTGGAEEEEAEV
jgi:hypothetical protein